MRKRRLAVADKPRLQAAFWAAFEECGVASTAARRAGVSESVGRLRVRQAGRAGVGVLGPGSRPRHPARAEFARLVASGVSLAEASRRVGIHRRTGQEWAQGTRRVKNGRIYPDGRHVVYGPAGTTMSFVNTSLVTLAALERSVDPRYLTLADREQIADRRRGGASLRAIGRALGRPASTIKREIDANSVDGQYNAYAAHRTAVGRRPRPKASKLAAPGTLREYVRAKLAKRWSPEQIHNTLINDFPDDKSMRVSVETIYQAVYLQARGGMKREVTHALRTGRTRRKTRTDPEQRASRFIDPMINISQRPAEVQDRAVPGHWEGDLITGAANGSAIATLVERTTRYLMLVHLPGRHDAVSLRDGLVATISTLPEHLRGSLTWDQGTEMALHKSFTMATGMDVYFCDPHSPWQRGSNENTNGLLRQYFPKGTDLRVHTPADLELVAHELNSRPRKTLGWATPAERLRDLLTP